MSPSLLWLLLILLLKLEPLFELFLDEPFWNKFLCLLFPRRCLLYGPSDYGNCKKFYAPCLSLIKSDSSKPLNSFDCTKSWLCYFIICGIYFVTFFSSISLGESGVESESSESNLGLKINGFSFSSCFLISSSYLVWVSSYLLKVFS